MPIRTGSEAEFRAGVTLASRVASANTIVDQGQIFYNVIAYGADNSGTTDNTAIYNSIFAIATSGIMYFPPGIYKGQIQYPATAGRRDTNWHVLGSGMFMTFLTPAASNTPILLKKVRNSGIVQGVMVRGFSVLAHPSGSTGTAIDMAGFRFCDFSHMGYFSNAGGDFASMFHFSSGQLLCHGNAVTQVVIDGGTVANTGPAAVVLFDTKDDAGVPAGAYPLGSANDHDFSFFSIYTNTGIATAMDLLAGNACRVHDCFFELNAGCTYIIPGAGTEIFNNHFESGVTVDTVLSTTSAFGTSNNTSVYGNEFSDLTAITWPVGTQDNEWKNNILDVPCTFTNNGLNNSAWTGPRHLGGLPSFVNNAAAAVTLRVGDRYIVTGSDPGVIAVVT